LVFSLSARKEAERKMLFGKERNSRSQEGDFFNLLIENTKTVAESSNLDIFWYDENKQQGATFAERFSNAFQEIFDKGYENVISIGNDCPYLTSEVLEKAVIKIQERDIVLGPSSDGGAYLIGLNKSVFKSEVFESFSWQEESLFQELLAVSFQNQQSVECLNLLSDVDTVQDVLELISSKPDIFLQFLGWCLKSFFKRFFSQGILFKYQFNQTYFSLRAPPGIA